jgi:predicted transcriptional regulator
MNDNLALMMAIKPKYTELIYKKSKSLEFRNKIAKRLMEHFKNYGNRYPVIIYIYESHPTKMITGYYLADYAWVMNKNVLEQFYKSHPKTFGIELEDLYQYYRIDAKTPNNEQIGYAVNILDAKKFEKPIPLWDIDLNYPPQDFIYLTPYDLEKIGRAVNNRV